METATVRSVRVQMNADVAKYVADMRLAGAETRKAFSGTELQGFSRELSTTERGLTSTNRQLSTTSQRMRQVDADTQRVSRSLQRGSSDLNQYTGRLGALVKAIAILGPAAVPLTASVIPALAGLTGGLGAAAGAAGVAMLAFHGVGDAVKAMDTYRLNPTVENLTKMHQAMAAMGPDGRDFVRLIDSLEPQLRELQNTARAGLLPGVEDSIGHLLGLLPQVRTFVSTISTEMGDLASDAGRSLATDSDWQAFFDYLQHDGGPIMDDFARSTGNVTAAVASLLRDFAPLESDFADGLEHSTAALRDWADGLDQTEGSHSFLDYIRTETPQVLALLQSLAGAVVALAQAAAPWGAVMVPVLTEVLRLFTAIASSPVGPILVEAAAGMAAFKAASGFLGLSGGLAGGAGLLGGIGKMRTGFRGLAGDIRAATVSLEGMTAAERAFNVQGSAAASAAVFEKSFAKQAALTRIAGGLAPVAGIGGTVLLANGIGERNTKKAAALNVSGGALLGASIGTMVGPEGTLAGAAIGAGVGALSGALVTLATHLHDTSDSVKKVTVDWSDLNATLDAQGRVTAQTKAAAGQSLLKSGMLSAASAAGINDTTTINAATGDRASLSALTSASRAKQAQLQNELGLVQTAQAHGAHVDSGDIDSLEQQIQAQKDLQSNVSKAAAELDAEAAAQQRLKAAAAGLTGTIKEQIAAQASLHQQALANFDAVTAWGRAVQAAAKQAASGAKGLNQYTAAGSANRQALSEMIQAWNAQPSKVKNNVAGYEAARSKLIQLARQMGATRAQVHDLTAAMDKPKTLVLRMQDQGVLDQIARIKAELASIPRSISTKYFVTQIGGVNKRAAMAQDRGADGTTVPKTGLPYADRHPYLLADGEEVISNRYGQADRNRAALKAANAGARLAVVGHAADGATAGALTGGAFTYSIATTSYATPKSAAATAKETKAAEKSAKAHAAAAAAAADAAHQLHGLHHTVVELTKAGHKQLSSIKAGADRWSDFSAKEMKQITAAEKATVSLGKMGTASAKQAKAFERAADKTEARLKTASDLAKQHHQAVLDDIASMRDSIAQRFTVDELGNAASAAASASVDPWRATSLAGASGAAQVSTAIGAMNQDTRDAAALNSSLSQVRAALTKQGVSKDQIDTLEKYLGQSASVSQAQALAASPALALQFEQAYTARQQQATTTGTTQANAVYAKAAAQSLKVQQQLLAEYRDAKHASKHIETRVNAMQKDLAEMKKHAPEQTGEAVASALNKTAKNARTR